MTNKERDKETKNYLPKRKTIRQTENYYQTNIKIPQTNRKVLSDRQTLSIWQTEIYIDNQSNKCTSRNLLLTRRDYYRYVLSFIIKCKK